MIIIEPQVVTDAVLTASNVPESDHPAYAPATTYAIGDKVIVVGVDIHKIYESLQSTNTGNDPATSPEHWLDLGATNRWRMFDESNSSTTSNPDSINITLATSGLANGIGLLGVVADTIQVILTDALDGVVYDKTETLSSVEGVNDWYTYFFNPIELRSTVINLDLPNYANTTINIIITNTASNAECSTCIIGTQQNLGLTQYGASLGIQDYSLKQKDAFGNTTILERAFSDNGSFTLELDSYQVDKVHSTLSKYRATPILYIGSEIYGSTVIYGFYKDFSVTIKYYNRAICSLDIEGLI